MRLKNTKGFTLLEVIIVVIIVAVLASVAVPKITSSVTFAKSKEVLGALPSIRSALEECYLLNSNSYATCNSLALLSVTFVPKYFNAPSISTTGTRYTVAFVSKLSASDTITYYSQNGSLVGAGNFVKIQQ